MIEKTTFLAEYDTTNRSREDNNCRPILKEILLCVFCFVFHIERDRNGQTRTNSGLENSRFVIAPRMHRYISTLPRPKRLLLLNSGYLLS
jgi:hypothetical protein